MSASTSDVLAAIDGALRDYLVSDDAMRWTPEETREGTVPSGASWTGVTLTALGGSALGAQYLPMDFLPFTFSYRTPGEMWREAVAEASAALPGFAGGAWASGWTCFRCALPPAPQGDVFGLGARRIRRVLAALAPAWQAGKLLEAFAV